MNKILSGVLFLAGFTSRSRAYAQAMLQAGIRPENILIFGPENGGLPGQSDRVTGTKDVNPATEIFLPDHSIPLGETCRLLGSDIAQINVDDINHPQVLKELKHFAPSLVVYSGYGAQIVGKKALALAPFLHVHSGWLPDERGSTTLYYGWLQKNRCGVSAILLSESIDTGPIIRRKEYPPPSKNIDPDHVYDGAIRADLLVEVLQEYDARGKFISMITQSGEGTSYYVIHPVLKHLARLRRNYPETEN